MPPRDYNDRLFHRAVNNIRFTLPDGVEFVGEVENVTLEGDSDTPDENLPIRLNLSEAIAATVREVDTQILREALMRAVIDRFDDWGSLGDDYELKDESEYQGTDPISFEELMDFGGESK